MRTSFLVRKVRRQKTAAIAVTALILMIIAVPLVAADNGNAHTIKVWPVGTTVETGMPIVTGTPASLFILHTGKGPIKNVWLLIVISKSTFDNLDIITLNGDKFMDKTDFKLATNSKIPPTAANGAYPGTAWQYEVAAIKSNMDETGKQVYWAIKYFLPQITTTPTDFTLAVKLTAPASIKALILGLGRYDDPPKTKSFGIECNYPFNRFTSYSKSTLVVPEIATLALIASPFAGLGLYTIRRRKK